MEKVTCTPRRHRLRLSLRTFFVLVTIVCLLLGLKILPAVRQREAVETIRKAGGGLAYDYQHVRGSMRLNAPSGEPPGPPWLRKLIGIDLFANVVRVDCQDTAFEDIDAIENLPQLEHLNLNATLVRDLSPLANLTRLHTLECRDTDIVTISPLGELVELQFLQLNGTRIRDLTPLSRLTNLEQLYLRGTEVQDVTPLGKLKALEFLGLRATRVQDVLPLRNLVNLKWLDLRETPTTPADLQTLQRALPKCNIEQSAQVVPASFNQQP
jgi:Leucine-rich repeat (LRR) protein